MTAIQKTKHLRVIRLHVKGVEISPVEAPEYPAEDATVSELTEAFVDLIARLTDAGILVPAGTEVENVYGIPGDALDAPDSTEAIETAAAEQAPTEEAPQQPAGALQDGEQPAA